IHQEVVQNFVSEAKRLEEQIRNDASMRRPLFSERDFREMAIHWTTTVDEMRGIRGIDQARVDKFGTRFVRLVRGFHEQYSSMMGEMDGDDSAPLAAAAGPGAGQQDIVDLISSDDDGFDDLDLDDGGAFDDEGPGEESRFS